MNPCLIPPVYFPTTVIFVDDNTDYLTNLSLQLDSDLSFKLYNSPSHALLECNTHQGVPVERLFAHRRDQPLFREDWREDLFYYFVSSLMVQVLTYISMAPALSIASHTHWTALRSWVGSQPVWVQMAV